MSLQNVATAYDCRANTIDIIPTSLVGNSYTLHKVEVRIKLTFGQRLCLLDLDLDDPVALGEPDARHDLVGGGVGDGRPQRPVAVRVRALRVALAHAVGAVPEQVLPPAVNLQFICNIEMGKNKFIVTYCCLS